MITTLLVSIEVSLLYLIWRAKDSQWHSQAVWEMLTRIESQGDNR